MPIRQENRGVILKNPVRTVDLRLNNSPFYICQFKVEISSCVIRLLTLAATWAMK